MKPAPRWLPASLAVLRHRAFRLYWLSQAVSLTGTWVQTVGLSWVIVGLSPSPLALGAANFVTTLPMLLLTPFGGVAADRLEKRRILLSTQVVLAVLALVLGVLVATGSATYWHVVVVAILVGIVAAYDLPATQGLTPELVPPGDVPKAVAFNQASFHGSRLIGPAVAGFLIGTLGVASTFVLNGLSFLAVVAGLLALRRDAPERAPARSTVPTSQRAAMAEGLRFVRATPQVRTAVLVTGLLTLLVFPHIAVLGPLYATEVLGLAADGFGWLMSASGLGALVGAVLLVALPQRGYAGRMRVGALGVVLALSLLAWARLPWLAAVAIGGLSLSMAATSGTAAAVVQSTVPPPLRGRVMGIYGLMYVGVMPFSSLGMAALAEVLSVPAACQVSAVLFGLLALLLLKPPGGRAAAAGSRPE
jgi:MFS family permease